MRSAAFLRRCSSVALETVPTFIRWPVVVLSRGSPSASYFYASRLRTVEGVIKLQVLVYDVLPSTTAVFSYAIGSRKLSANEQFFVGAQTVVRLLQTTQIISDVCFITDHIAYASSNKTKIV